MEAQIRLGPKHAPTEADAMGVQSQWSNGETDMNQKARGLISPYVSTSFKDGVFTVHMTAAKVGEHEAAIISAAAHRTIKQHGRSMKSLVLDVSGVTSMQSIGLGMCIDLRNTAKAFGVPTILGGLAGRLEELFTLLKIDRLFETSSPRDVVEVALAA